LQICGRDFHQGHRLLGSQRSKPHEQAILVWYNPARVLITTVLSDKYMAMVGEPDGKDWGTNEAGMKH
jgi:arylsulfatase